jgi:hypothetical protein
VGKGIEPKVVGLSIPLGIIHGQVGVALLGYFDVTLLQARTTHFKFFFAYLD